MRTLQRSSIGKRLLVLFLSGAMLCSMSGCVYLVVGGIGALGGYVISPDTVEGMTKSDMDSVFDTAHDVLAIMGTINEEHKEGGILIARVNGVKVTVTLSNPTPEMVKVNVKARKAFFPKISVAQDVFVKIMSQLSE